VSCKLLGSRLSLTGAGLGCKAQGWGLSSTDVVVCSSQPLNEERRSCKVTGLAVTKLLRRLDLLTSGKPEAGDIILSAGVLQRWKRLAEK